MSLTQKKIALITGANKGLGFEISRQLARLGIKVVMGVRDAANGQVAVNQLLQDGLDVEFKCLDVTHTKSIEAIRGYIDKTYGKLDILVNNAGVCLDSGQKPSTARRKSALTLNPSPKGRGTLNPAPLAPWERGWG